MATLLGIEIGGSKLQLVVGDETGRITDRRRFAVDRGEAAAAIRKRIEEALPGLLEAHEIESVGVGFGGPVDRQSGKLACSHQVEGWSGFPLQEWLGELTRLGVAVENDSNLAALAEGVLGAGKGFNPAAYVNMGSGVGGGLVVDGRLYHGAAPGECEIGHLRLNREGATVESRCSGWAADGRIRELCGEEPESKLAELARNDPGGEARHLDRALAGGDRLARRVLDEIAADLAFGLSHLVHLLHPEVIVMGGGLSLVGEPLRLAVAEALRPHVMEVFQSGPEIRLAHFAEDAVPVGALLLAAP